MTPEYLADLHAKCFSTPRPWDAAAFSSFLHEETVTLWTQDQGFLLVRMVLDEAEILTLAVHPSHRRQGTAGKLLRNFHQIARAKGVKSAFLEVMSENSAAKILYQKLQYHEVGRRRGYYTKPNGEKSDALVMRRQLS